MSPLRVALVCAVLLRVAAGCDRVPAEPAAPIPTPEPSSPAAPAAPAKEPAITEPAEAEPVVGGACATHESCSAAASIEERAKRFDKAAALYERACELGLPQACHRAGELYRDGKGVAPDEARARALFESGCREGSSAACDALGH